MRIGMRASGAQLLCRHQRQKRAAGPTVPQFPRCEDRETVARAPCWEVGFGEDPGESGTVKTADVQPRPSPSALGRSDFSLVLLGLNTLHGSMAERPRSAGRGGGPLRLGAPCSPSGPGSSPSSTSCIRTLRPSELLPPAAPCPSCCSGHGGFSQELGQSQRWLPRLPQLVAALRSDTPAHTVPNSQLIHQLGSPGGFPGNRCPG